MSLPFFRRRQPPTPANQPRIFSIPCAIAGAVGILTIDGRPGHPTVATAGRLIWLLPATYPLQVGGWLRVTAEGFQPFDCRVLTPKTPTGDLQLWSVEPNAPLADQRVVLTPIPASTYPPETGRITVDNRQFWNSGPWTWVGMSDFLLFARFLFGQDVLPQIRERRELGAKVLRIFSMVDSFGRSRSEPFAHLYPQEHADYYTALELFVGLLNDEGLRIELTLFADAQAVMPSAGDQDAHAEKCYTAVEIAGRRRGMTNFMEGGNETGKESNLPGGEARGFEIMRRFQGRSPYVLVASGSSCTDIVEGAADPPFVLDYVTEHLDRGDEWVRKHIDLANHRDGFQWDEKTFGPGRFFKGTRVPTISDEPRGLDETVWGSRTTDTVAAGQVGGVAAMMGNGITFHCQSGILSEMLGPIQLAGAKAMLTAARFIPPEVQLLNYARGSDRGACSWAYGASPVAHEEGPGKRSYTKWLGSDYWVVQAGSTKEHVEPCAGFALIEEPVQGVARLRQL